MISRRFIPVSRTERPALSSTYRKAHHHDRDHLWLRHRYRHPAAGGHHRPGRGHRWHLRLILPSLRGCEFSEVTRSTIMVQRVFQFLGEVRVRGPGGGGGV